MAFTSQIAASFNRTNQLVVKPNSTLTGDVRYSCYSSRMRSSLDAMRLRTRARGLALWVFVCAGLLLYGHQAAAQDMPHRPVLPGFGGLCDGGPLPCSRIDDFAFNARIDAILLPNTSLRNIGFVAPYGFSIAAFGHVEGGIYTHTSIWDQPVGTQSQTMWRQGPMRFAVKGLLWPLTKSAQRRFSALLDFEYEARLPHFDGVNQLGLLTDLGALRGVVNLPIGLTEIGLTAGALFDWQGRYGTAEVGARAGFHLPFLPDVKVFAEGLARGFISSIQAEPSTGPLPGTSDPRRPIVPGGALGFGIASRMKRQVDFAMVVHVGFGDVAPFFLTLRFADVVWGKGYDRPQSIVVDAVREFAAWVREQAASIDPIFNDTCLMLDDAPNGHIGKSMDLLGHKTSDRQHCIWQGLWLRADAHYWKNKPGTLLCHDEARKHCFAERKSSKEPWEPLENPAHTAVLRSDCIFEDEDTKGRLTHFGQLAPDGRNCTDGNTTFRIGERTAYNPELRQIDRGMQGTARQHPPLEYEAPPTGLQRLATALGRGIEAGQQENRESEARTKAQAAAADRKIEAVRQKAEEMTPASLMNGLAAAEREAEADIRHAGADPKGTFNRTLATIKHGIDDTALAVKEGVVDTAHRAKDGVVSAAQGATVWAKEPAIEKAEDLLKFGGRAGATAPRDMTVNVATGIVTGGVGRVLGEVVLEGKATKRLLNLVDKEAESGHRGSRLLPRRGNGGRGGGPDHAKVQARLVDELDGRDEVPIRLPNGEHRIVDVRGADGSLNQIGDMRTRGTPRPAARERAAIEDLRTAKPDADINFFDKHDQHPPLSNPDLKPDWKPAPKKLRKNPG